ncbi:hypothetical protein OJ998_25460 [Solirubrobacter taibaiensis]|nr:hypothetical protein [Solirubrobacter taibaiensis]
MRDDKPVPEPGEAGRGDDEIHYYEVDETNVSEADRSEPPAPDKTPESEDR